ncbi:MAG TPA: DUF2490 domain-containing protein [Pyrinomonadaceae bacterium]|jgi:hypothetical protein
MKFQILFFLIIFGSLSAFSQTTPPESDFQFWNETQVAIPIVKSEDKNKKEFDRVSLFFSGTLRFGRNYTQFIDERIGFGFDFKVNKYLTLTPSYLYRAAQPYENRKEFESRFRFAATLENKWTRFSVRDRNLVEYRLRNSRADSVRYRNKLQFNFPVHKDKKEILAPFVADEIFYDFHEEAWTRNELTLGISKKFSPALTADFFYLYQRNRGNVLRVVNALGVNLKFKFDRKSKKNNTQTETPDRR